MNYACKGVRAGIEESMFRAIAQSQQDIVDEHVKNCAACCEYLEIVHREDRSIADFIRSNESSIDRIERGVMQALGVRISRKSKKPKRI